MAHYQRLDIMMICAASPPPAPRQSQRSGANFMEWTAANELNLRMMDAVQADLNAMYSYCKKQEFVTGSTVRGRQRSLRSKVNIVRLLVNDDNLQPTPSLERVEGCTYEPEVFRNKDELREAVREFLSGEDDDDQVPNLMIYYSGHGVHEFNRHLGRSEEALEMVVDGRTIHYTDSELTKDVNLHLAGYKKLYLVIDACHSEGMLNLWELKTRLSKFVVLFAGANTEIRADYSSKGGAFTLEFVKWALPGKQLCEIEQSILERLFDGKKRSPAVRYGEPKLCVQRYLA